ncbi:MAG TPA: 16S rRNA (guanine(527)-N(7))-methyltransferase RsmG [Vicinamibacterales bacterium]|nr:16S rRNA (guanine(527)-N(7))-methyltransferase RsmG [Vicinamibacterales bacterium]
MSSDLADRIVRRSALAGQEGIPAISAEEARQLAAYLELLRTWNARINLTALPLEGFPDETLDRLILEPIVIKRLIPDCARNWVDLGSGGGSPAVPLKIVRPDLNLEMVESRARKVAFLREACRQLKLDGALVHEGRIEELPARLPAGSIHLITVRAVRLSKEIVESIAFLLPRAKGQLAVFAKEDPALDAAAFHETLQTRLPSNGGTVYWYQRL